MAKVTGIGGVFFRAQDPEALLQWYKERLGMEMDDGYWLQPASKAASGHFRRTRHTSAQGVA